MFGAPQITFVGNLVDDPELRFTPSGAAVANMRFAITPRIKKNDQYEDGETVWLSGSVWRDYAENVCDSLTKGMRVFVSGQLMCRSYEVRDTGEKRVSWEVEIEHIGPVLRNATARVNKVSRTSADGSQPAQNATQQPPPNPFAGGQTQQQAAQPPAQQPPPPAQQQAPPSTPVYNVGDVVNGYRYSEDGQWHPAQTQPPTAAQQQAPPPATHNPTGQVPAQQADQWQTPPPAQDAPPF